MDKNIIRELYVIFESMDDESEEARILGSYSMDDMDKEFDDLVKHWDEDEHNLNNLIDSTNSAWGEEEGDIDLLDRERNPFEDDDDIEGEEWKYGIEK